MHFEGLKLTFWDTALFKSFSNMKNIVIIAYMVLFLLFFISDHFLMIMELFHIYIIKIFWFSSARRWGTLDQLIQKCHSSAERKALGLFSSSKIYLFSLCFSSHLFLLWYASWQCCSFFFGIMKTITTNTNNSSGWQKNECQCVCAERETLSTWSLVVH